MSSEQNTNLVLYLPPHDAEAEPCTDQRVHPPHIAVVGPKIVNGRTLWPDGWFPEQEASDLFTILSMRLWNVWDPLRFCWAPESKPCFRRLSDLGYKSSFWYKWMNNDHARREGEKVAALLTRFILKLKGHEYCFTKELVTNQIIHLREVVQVHSVNFRRNCQYEPFQPWLAEQQGWRDVYYEGLLRWYVNPMLGWRGRVVWERCAVCGMVRRWKLMEEDVM